MSADADRIAQLTAELAEARRAYNVQSADLAQARGERETERAAHERTKAELARVTSLLATALDLYDAGGGGTDESEDWADDVRRILADPRSAAAVAEWAADAIDQRDAAIARAEQAEARVVELTAALDRDQTGLAAALGAIKQRVGAGWWITEGRGSYAWDDDRYRRETAIVLGDVAELASNALHASGDIANGALVDTPLATWDAARELRKRLADAIAREQAAQAQQVAMAAAFGPLIDALWNVDVMRRWVEHDDAAIFHEDGYVKLTAGQLRAARRTVEEWGEKNQEGRTLASRLPLLEAAIKRVAETDTHGKNVPDEHGNMRPTGRDFCGRCNRNSFHPHADDCPITDVIALAALDAREPK